jgi:hypothetical protein
MNLSFFTFSNGFHIGVKFSVFCYSSKNAVKKIILVLLAHLQTLSPMGTTQNKKDPLKKIKYFLAFCIPMSMKIKRVGRATSVRSPSGTAASNLTLLNVKGFSAKYKKFAKQKICSKNWSLSQISCENAEK